MAIKVTKVGGVSGTIIAPSAGKRTVDFTAILTNFEGVSEPADQCNWQLPLVIGEGANAREVLIDLALFVSKPDYVKSKSEPIFLDGKTITNGSCSLIFFRDRF